MADATATPYNGLWWDYTSNSRILTLSGKKASALQAAIPIAVTFVGAQVWPIVRIVFYHLHRRRTPPKSSAQTEDYRGYLQQRRVILRNAPSGISLFFQLCSQTLHWRSFIHRNPGRQPKKHGFRYPTPAMMVVCLIHFGGWIIVGVFVSYLWTAGYVTQQALARGSNCGTLSLENSMDLNQQRLFEIVNNNQTLAGDQYVKQCYTDTPSSSAACGYFPQTRLKFNHSDADCPFDISNNCVMTNSTPIVMDSNYIDTSENLGINADFKDRIYFRKLTTCSPISSQDYAVYVNASETAEASLWPPNSTLYRYYYGNIPGNGSFATNWTFEVSSWKASDGYAYDLTTNAFFGGAPTQTWNPNATFWPNNRTDADVVIFFLNGDHVVYDNQTNDPFFLTGSNYIEPVNGQTVNSYTPEYYTNVLACIDQYQICPGDRSREYCSAVSGIYQLGNDIFNLDLNAAQLATAQRIVGQFSSLSTYASAAGRGGAALLASLSVVQDTQTKALPVDQWRQEVTQWFSISLAKLQQSAIDFAVGPADQSLIQYIRKPQDALASQCNSQRIMLPSGSTNFNFSAIIIIAVVGGFLWLLGTGIERLVDSILLLCSPRSGSLQPSRARTRARKSRLDWILDGPCQLQRLAYKAAGYGKWERAVEDTPVWRYDFPGQVAHIARYSVDEPVLA